MDSYTQSGVNDLKRSDPFQGMGHCVLPDFPEQCKPLTSVIGSGKSNFRPEQYTCLADGRKNRQEEGRCGKGKRKENNKKNKTGKKNK